MRSFRATPTRRSRSCGNTSRASSKPSARFCRREIVRVFYATDLHGSEVCWRKFLNAAKFYDADVLICGGDMTGKAMIPLGEPDAVAHLSGGARRGADQADGTHAPGYQGDEPRDLQLPPAPVRHLPRRSAGP